jgi:hypothetical protein
MRRFVLAATTAALFTLTGCATAPQTSTEPVPQQEPAATTTSAASATTWPELRFDQDTETLARNIATAFTNVINEGGDDQLATRRYDANMTYADFLPIVAAQNAENFRTRYFTAENSADTEASLTLIKNVNRGNLDWFQSTYENTNDPRLLEGYKQFVDVGGARETSNDGTRRVIEIDIVETDNTAGKIDSPLIGELGTVMIAELVNVDGDAKFTKFLPRPR